MKSREKLWVKLPEQFHLRGRQIALRGRAHDCNRANESPTFPEKENYAVAVVSRRHVTAIEGRFLQAASI